jgi:hypothetical protein
MPVAEEPEDRIATLLESEGFRRILGGFRRI